MGARASKIDPVGVVVFVRDLLLVEEMGHLGLACAARGSPKETLFCSEYCTVRFVCRFVVTQYMVSHSGSQKSLFSLKQQKRILTVNPMHSSTCVSFRAHCPPRHRDHSTHDPEQRCSTTLLDSNTGFMLVDKQDRKVMRFYGKTDIRIHDQLRRGRKRTKTTYN
jgi:hypothetical protein